NTPSKHRRYKGKLYSIFSDDETPNKTGGRKRTPQNVPGVFNGQYSGLAFPCASVFRPARPQSHKGRIPAPSGQAVGISVLCGFSRKSRREKNAECFSELKRMHSICQVFWKLY